MTLPSTPRLFKQIDRNGDGMLTCKEIEKGLAAMEKSGIAGPADASMKAKAKAVCRECSSIPYVPNKFGLPSV
jgi:hypothetical protein